ncbi:MAG TPA: 1-acyl-sn-glycerol-3-phosphate acyltransferase, partial [Acidimicrobiia bacterium]|nr:1-acyl-sn-glycerol-3-phosphate acyltransferase [Acidimicrobiia bacterium]
MAAPFHPPNASAGGADRDPARVLAEIVSADAFRGGLDRLAAEQGRPRSDLDREARTALGEMVAVQSPLAVGALDRLARFALRAYDIEVDTDALDSLRALNRSHALVFLPSHKSYLDPFILRGALGREGLPCNHILGGVNVSFWPMGPVLRRSGVVFIRRSIKDDAVYKLALRSYLGHLVERRYNLEWYLEGGRSRTGKLRPPRLGVLAYLVEAFREGGVDDVFLVPVSIAYDQLAEVAAMAAEEHGAEKKAESFAWMLRYLRSQGQRLGKAYVNVAEPISLLQAWGEKKAAPERILVGKIAFEVLHRINRVTPVTPTSLLTLALLGLGDRALTPAEIRSVLDPLLDYVAVRKLPQAGTVDLATPAGLRPALDALVTTKVVTRFTDGAEPVYAIGQNQHLVAAYSRNRIIHFFVTRAITELVLLHLVRRPVGHSGDGDLGARAWAEALRLRDLLKYEFFFAAKPEFAEELRAELAILDPDWQRKADDPTAIATGLAELPLVLGHRVLGSFLEAYMVVA